MEKAGCGYCREKESFPCNWGKNIDYDLHIEGDSLTIAFEAMDSYYTLEPGDLLFKINYCPHCGCMLPLRQE